MSSPVFLMASNPSGEQFVNIPATTLYQKRVDLVHKLREGPRLRRRHTKSRNGCVACKKRRIKCDEAVPVCDNCTKREEHCVRPSAFLSRASSTPPSPPPVTRRKAPRHNEVSLHGTPSIEFLCLTEDHGFQRELVHHFVKHTATTLVFSSELWRGPLLRLSLQVDYLHNAILMIAATHRSFLAASSDPGRDRHHHSAQKYLATTLRGYQDALSHPISSTHGDALIAVSLLLYHYAWSDVHHTVVTFASPQSPSTSPEPTHRLDLAADPLLNLSVGLRYLFWKTGALAAGSDSPFRPYALEKPRAKIVQAVKRQQQEHDTLGEMESYLLEGYRSQGLSIADGLDSSALQFSSKGPAGDSLTLAAFSESAGRLAPIMAALSSSVGILDGPGTRNASNPSGFDCGPAVELRDIIRYLFSYPIHFCDTFRSLVARQDRRALFLLLHFFYAVRRLLPPDRCWWSQRRAMLFEHHLEGILNMQPPVPEQFAVLRATSPRMEFSNEWAYYQVRDWLDGECIHGQF